MKWQTNLNSVFLSIIYIKDNGWVLCKSNDIEIASVRTFDYQLLTKVGFVFFINALPPNVQLSTMRQVGNHPYCLDELDNVNSSRHVGY